MNNTTTENEIECTLPETDQSLPLYFDVIRVALYLIIIISSLLGNSAVLVCVFKVQRMRTFTNILICNAAVADLLITLVPNVHTLLNIIVYKGAWELGR